MIFATLYVTAIEATDGIWDSGGVMFCGVGKDWKVTCRASYASSEAISFYGSGECPWKINQKLQVTVAPFPEKD